MCIFMACVSQLCGLYRDKVTLLIWAKVYAYTIVLTVIGPEDRGRELRLEEDDETLRAVGDSTNKPNAELEGENEKAGSVVKSEVAV